MNEQEVPTNTEPVEADVPEVGDEVSPGVSVAHVVEENPEDHLGVETKDPWVDETQTDWPNHNPSDTSSM